MKSKRDRSATHATQIQQGIDAYSASLFRPGWRGVLRFNWKLAAFLIMLFGASRFFLVLQASVTHDYRWVSALFVVMILTPFILLTAEGRKHIGLKKPAHLKWIGISVLLGVLLSLFVYAVGKTLFGTSTSNWYVYIAQTYPASAAQIADNRLMYFLILGISGMIFSPLGEEILYRGLIHTSVAMQADENLASRVDSAAFAVTHLAHFGIVWTTTGWDFLPVPALLWMICMFMASRVFYFCKAKTDSLIGAMVAHAAFNLTMTASIVFWLV